MASRLSETAHILQVRIARLRRQIGAADELNRTRATSS
jgi:hypothetical protein